MDGFFGSSKNRRKTYHSFFDPKRLGLLSSQWSSLELSRPKFLERRREEVAKVSGSWRRHPRFASLPLLTTVPDTFLKVLQRHATFQAYKSYLFYPRVIKELAR